MLPGEHNHPEDFSGRLIPASWSLGGFSCDGLGNDAHAGSVEEKGFDFSFGSLSRKLLTIPEECHSRGVANPGDDLPRGANGGVGGSD